MDRKPKFSVITASFNSAKTIERTILSVLGQSYSDFEYIIIDGGSTDGTVNIIKKYESRISYWVSEKDKGISDAFNKGVSVSKGEIIGIINSDDSYEPDALEKIAKLDSDSQGDFYVGALRYWSDNRSKIVYPDQKYKRTISFHMPHLNHPASFFKKTTYDEIGAFNLEYKYAMDYDIFLRAYLKGKKGAFTNVIITNMFSGGVSDLDRSKVYREVFHIASNKFLGLIWYFLSLLKLFIIKFIKIFKK